MNTANLWVRRQVFFDKSGHGGHMGKENVHQVEDSGLHDGGGDGGLAQAPHLVTANVKATRRLVNLHHLGPGVADKLNVGKDSTHIPT